MHRLQQQFPIPGIDFHGVTIANGAVEDGTGNAVFHLSLDDALERTGTELWIIAHVCQQFFSSIAQMECDVALGQTWAQAIDLYFHDLLHLIASNLLEDNHLVNAVDELWSETLFAQALTHQALHTILVHAIKFMQPGGTHVPGHDNDRVFEIDRATLTICQAAIVEDLQQHVEDLRRGLFDLVEEYNAIGSAADGFGKLTSLLIADIAWRGANQP